MVGAAVPEEPLRPAIFHSGQPSPAAGDVSLALPQVADDSSPVCSTRGAVTRFPAPCQFDLWCADCGPPCTQAPALQRMQSVQTGGIGPPLTTELMGKRREFVDGGGLCSPGRWAPAQRQQSPPVAEDCFAALHRILHLHCSPRDVLIQLACQKHSGSPFPDDLLSEARAEVCKILKNHGARLPLGAVPERQPFHLALVEDFLRLCGDPDYAAFYTASESFAKGVRIGVDADLPRTPEVFGPKVKWRDYEGEKDPDPVMRSNYPTAAQHADILERQFEDEAKLGAMVKMPLDEAKQRYGSKLRVASLGAIQKTDDTFRVIHDATHGTGVNGRIYVQDHLVCPTAGDLRQAVRTLEGASFVLTADVKRAHRLVKIAEGDWGYQACRARSEADYVWLNTVGSFGVSSAAVHWARLMSGLQRATFYLLGRAEVFLLTYVDDLLWIVRGSAAMDSTAVALFFLVMVGLPMSWRKCKGGISVDWVGYHINLEKKTVGINVKRTRWLLDWCNKALERGTVSLGDFRSVIGRMSFAFAALEHLRPFLGPLYAWVAAVKADAAPLPEAVALSLRFIRDMLQKGYREQRILKQVGHVRELFRTDAKAEGEEIWIGGWCIADGGGVGSCRWFSERLDRKNASWAFLAGQPFRAIASLEMLATLVALVVFGHKDAGRVSMVCSASTDNLGNACVLRRWLTTKFPLSCILMEIAAILVDSNLEMALHWLPRLQNTEADALTNSDYRGFNPELRQHFCLEEYDGIVLKEMLAAGEELFSEIKAARQKKAKTTAVTKTQPLRVCDPWEGPGA